MNVRSRFVAIVCVAAVAMAGAPAAFGDSMNDVVASAHVDHRCDHAVATVARLMAQQDLLNSQIQVLFEQLGAVDVLRASAADSGDAQLVAKFDRRLAQINREIANKSSQRDAIANRQLQLIARCPNAAPPTITCPDGSVNLLPFTCPDPPPPTTVLPTTVTCPDGTVHQLPFTCPPPPPPPPPPTPTITCLNGSVNPVPFDCPPIPLPPGASSDVVTLACNSTLQHPKFEFAYQVIAVPSASPITAGLAFDVTFDVTAVVSAEYLNSLYASLSLAGQPAGAIPITEAAATVAPLSGATGPAVQIKLIGTRAAPIVTIPAPTTLPVTSGFSVPLGAVTGSYTADASGTASFTFVGNAWAPALASPPTAADVLPPGVTEPGWIGSLTGPPTAVLTPTGSLTRTRLSLVNGLVTPHLLCMGGNWTSAPPIPPALDPTLGAPLLPDVGFGNFAIL